MCESGKDDILKQNDGNANDNYLRCSHYVGQNEPDSSWDCFLHHNGHQEKDVENKGRHKEEQCYKQAVVAKELRMLCGVLSTVVEHLEIISSVVFLTTLPSKKYFILTRNREELKLTVFVNVYIQDDITVLSRDFKEVH